MIIMKYQSVILLGRKKKLFLEQSVNGIINCGINIFYIVTGIICLFGIGKVRTAMSKKYIKKPVVIEAVQWTGINKNEVEDFIKDFGSVKGDYVDIATLEGLMVASIGDFIIKGVKGEFYPCKPDIFEMSYIKMPGAGEGQP